MALHSETWNNVLTLSQVTKVKVQSILEHLACTEELTVQQMIVLFNIHSHTVSNVGDISKKILLKQANISTLIKKMEILGLLERKKNQTDVRVVDLSLTSKGEQKVNNILTIIEDMYCKISKDKDTKFDAEEIKCGFLALSRMIDYFYEYTFLEEIINSFEQHYQKTD